MEDDNIKNVQVKQEYLIYGLAAALIVIVILVGSLLYIISSQSSATPGTGDPAASVDLPPGHPTVRDGAVPGPLDPSQIPQGQTGTGSNSQTPPAPNSGTGQTAPAPGGGATQNK